MGDSAETPDDPLIGVVINGRYELVALAEKNELSALYTGRDSQTQATVGIRVTNTPEAHRRMHEWLGEAILSRGKDAILAVGHIDRKHSFIVLAEAALEYLRPEPIERYIEERRQQQPALLSLFKPKKQG